jgi:parallel beta helix pectate lyase-like protein
MRTLSTLFNLILIATSAFAGPVQRTFVSAATGSDTNPCSRTAPCRNFTAALPLTAPGGEVLVLDSGGYGPATVTQAVAINAPDGVYAGISVFSGTGLLVSAAATDSVVLRGLTVLGLGGTDAIGWSSGNDLHVENCVLSTFPLGAGVNDHSNSSADTTLLISGTTIRLAGTGVLCDGGTGASFAKINIDRSRLEGTNFGYVGTDFQGNVRATITRTVAAGLGAGIFTEGSGAEVTVDWCELTQNGAGIQTNGSLIRVTNSTLSNNGVAYEIFPNLPGVIESGGNNLMRGNENPGFGTLTMFSPM